MNHRTSPPAAAATFQLWPAFAHPEFTASVRQFARDRIAPEADEIDRKDVYPTAIVKELARLGFSAITLPETYGGQDRDFSHAVILFEEVSVASAAVGVSLLT